MPSGGSDQRLFDEAFAAYGAGDNERARDLLGDYFKQGPGVSRAYLVKGVLCGPPARALGLALVEQAAYLDPADAQAWYNLGVVQTELNMTAAAIASYSRAVGLDPVYIDAVGNLAEALRRDEQFEAALDMADRQVAAGADGWGPQIHRAISLLHLRRMDEAEDAFGAAEAFGAPREALAWERFSLMLFQRRFAEAWDDYETRFANGEKNGVFAYPFPQPRWTGQKLKGKHILVHNEQGLGDQLMYAQALGEVVNQAETVTLVAAPTLVPVFKASFPSARVLPARYGEFAGDHPPPSWLPDLGEIDYQAPIGSLMAILRRTSESFADPKPYLRPSDEARARWAGFDSGGALKVGLCWASNPALFRNDSARRAVRKSMRLEVMAPLSTIAGIDLVSVLNWPITSETAHFARPVMDVSDRLVSMDDTAALIERLDLVITVDTAVAHLSGALGKETWLLLHDFADCRWELTADRSYWYPNVRLIRQTEPADWERVIAIVAGDLRRRVQAQA